MPRTRTKDVSKPVYCYVMNYARSQKDNQTYVFDSFKDAAHEAQETFKLTDKMVAVACGQRITTFSSKSSGRFASIVRAVKL